ncbi:MAG: hypothetical protein ACLQU6_04390 [Limisphaerales bacterium]
MGARKGSLAASRESTTPAARAVAGNRGGHREQFERLFPRTTVLDFPFTAKRESWRWRDGVGTWRQFVRAWCDTRARRNGACRWRVTAPRSPRARGLGNGKLIERAGCGELVAALLEKQRR